MITKHRLISFIKSIIRIFGFSFLTFSIVGGTLILTIAEAFGIVEEFYEKE